jgi:hypothetical protein
MIFAALIGIANYAIYMATIDYMVCAYGPYSASATGGNGWARDFLAGVLTLPSTPFFTNIGKPHNLEYANTILFCISTLLVAAVYVIYWKGPELRKRSKFAQQLADASKENEGRRPSVVSHASRHQSLAGYGGDEEAYGPRRGSMGYVRGGSQAGSAPPSRSGSLNLGTPAGGPSSGVGRPVNGKSTSYRAEEAHRRWMEDGARTIPE